jgi:hypothetical protein
VRDRPARAVVCAGAAAVVYGRLGVGIDDRVDRLPDPIDAAAGALGALLDERAHLPGVVATILVPLTFVTGCFGMDFGWTIDHIESPLAFWILGFAIPVGTALVGDDGRWPLALQAAREVGPSRPSWRPRATASARLCAPSLA